MTQIPVLLFAEDDGDSLRLTELMVSLTGGGQVSYIGCQFPEDVEQFIQEQPEAGEKIGTAYLDTGVWGGPRYYDKDKIGSVVRALESRGLHVILFSNSVPQDKADFAEQDIGVPIYINSAGDFIDPHDGETKFSLKTLVSHTLEMNQSEHRDSGHVSGEHEM